MRRHVRLAACACAVFACTWHVALSASDGLVLVEKGQARAVIVCGPQCLGAAKLLRDTIQRSTGAALALVDERQAGERVQVHVGLTGRAKRLGLPPADLDRDGFVVRRDGPRLLLVGKDPTSTEFAVIEFLERFVGFRCFFPGKLGTCLDKLESLVVPPIHLRREPHFKSRLMSGMYGAGGFMRLNRFRRRYEFHHNLLRILRPSTYAKTHPEFYPVRSGRRYVPASDDDHSWQPCLTCPGVLRVCVETARKFFDAHPDAVGFSLGVNDSRGFCTCPACMDERRRLGEEEGTKLSNYYFTFLNKVADQVAKTHPGKILGCLGYVNVRWAPDFALRDNICVYICNDRSQYSSPGFRRRDIEILREWSRVCKRPCIYEWLFGGGFVVPRIYTRRLHTALNATWRCGGDGYYSEAYPNWALDGPKLWIVSRLLWDLDEDPAALRREFCQKLYGAAADTMNAYYRELERLWVPPRDGVWGERIHSFYQPDQLDCYPAEAVERLEAMLRRAAAEADSALAKARVAHVVKGFTLTAMFARQRAVCRAPGLASPAAGGGLAAMLKALGQARAIDKTIWDYVRSEIVPDRWTFHRKGAGFESVAAPMRRAIGVDYAQILSLGAIRRIVAREAEAFRQAGGKGDLEKRLRDALARQSARHGIELGGRVIAGVPRAPKPPRIDGTIDPAEWTAAARLTGLTLLGGKTLAKEQTVLHLMWDDRHIYVAADCVEAEAPVVLAAHTQRDTPVYRDDDVELFLIPPRRGADTARAESDSFYQIIVSPIATIYDAYAASPTWDAHIAPKTRVAKGRWQMELAVPWDDLGGKPSAWEVWRANFCRGNRSPTGRAAELSSWARARSAFNDPTYFGLLVFRP